MAIRKFTTLQLHNDARVIRAPASSSVRTAAKLSDFEFTPEPGFLYVTTRAISSRVNANYDGWPPDELRKSWNTFIGRPTYVDHTNWDLKRSRGVILDAKLHENKLASGHEDVWVNLLIEVDAVAFPRLAQAIETGDIDAVSMGADVEYTICSVCANKAHDVLEYCAHIPQMKGRIVEDLDRKTGSRIKKLCYEDCFGVSFFEISFVFDPADESALISDVMHASASNRSLAHVRQPNERVAAYSERVGTSSLRKVATVQGFCLTCGDTNFVTSKKGASCKFCGTLRTADKTLMSLPQEVDTLRDELNCPQCGSEWDGMVCLNCGFELPPEGLADPDTDPMGLNLPMGAPTPEEQVDGEAEGEEEGSDEESDSSDDDGKSAPPKSKDKKKDDKAKDKKDDKKSDTKSKDKSDKKKEPKKSAKEELYVSRFDDLQKQATLPVDPPYRQDTSPANSVTPYGEAIPGGTPPAGVEPALEPAPAAQAVVQALDAPDVQGPIGQSEVDVVSQPEGPTNVPPPGPQAGEALNGGKAASSREKKKAAFLRTRANALRERAAEFEKQAETITQTDVRNLDEPPMVDVGPDATMDVLKATQQAEQLLLADTPDVINDGSETGVPPVRDRLNQQVNPFNDAALAPYQPVNQQVASVESEEVKEATRKAREDQRVAAAKTRVLRIANFVDERIEMGLNTPAEKFAEIARYEEMGDETLDGHIQATREFKAKETKLANKRVRVAARNNEDTGPVRMPSLGSASRPPVEEDDDPADDYVAFL